MLRAVIRHALPGLGVVGGQRVNRSALREELLRRLEERLLQPEVCQSPEVVTDMLADDCIEYGKSGQVFNKQQIIEVYNR